MRKWTSILSCLVLALTFLQAPFMHVHEHEENNFHPGGIFHTHFAHIEKPSNHPEVRDFDPDDDAQDQQWFSAVAPHLEIPLAMPLSIRLLAITEVSQPFAERVIESVHDPPRLTRSAPRAPPL